MPQSSIVAGRCAAQVPRSRRAPAGARARGADVRVRAGNGGPGKQDDKLGPPSGVDYYKGMFTRPLSMDEDENRVRASESVGRAAKLGLQAAGVLVVLLLGFMGSNGLLPFQK
ncbi:unnamed protein product [Pedinophyceae sp. YPF-701]|nr:unnamed protein product [Pedinophyceae sp. YPF-701]